MRIFHVLRKPLSEGTVAANTLKHGTGGLNIDVSRITSDGSHIVTGVVRRGKDNLMADRTGIGDGPGMYAAGSSYVPSDAQKLGRWPANVILQHLDGCRCDGVKMVKGITGGTKPHRHAAPITAHGGFAEKENRPYFNHADKDGKETVVNWICEPGCPVARLDEDTGSLKVRGNRGPSTSSKVADVYGKLNAMSCGTEYNHDTGSTGGASRFYKQVGGKSDG